MVFVGQTTKYVFATHPGDVFWCTADCGWVTGHSYVTYGQFLLLQFVLLQFVLLHMQVGGCSCIPRAGKVSAARSSLIMSQHSRAPTRLPMLPASLQARCCSAPRALCLRECPPTPRPRAAGKWWTSGRQEDASAMKGRAWMSALASRRCAAGRRSAVGPASRTCP